MEKILVFGFYNKSNIGDDLFETAFKKLFPNHKFEFVDHISVDNLNNINTVFIGGGSFLNEIPDIHADALSKLKSCKIFYIGVGAETEISPIHKDLMSIAKLIAIRTPQFLDKIKSINSNVITIPDLVYCLNPTLFNKIDKSVLILPNIVTVPKYNEPYWKYTAWDYFKTEFAQFLDEIIKLEYKVNFFPMSINDELNDNNGAIEIINRMEVRSNKHILKHHYINDIHSVTKLISQYNLVITQRYHGIVLADLCNVPSLSIYHHDKLDNSSSVPYYGVSKKILMDKFIKLINSNPLPIKSNMFDELVKKVNSLIGD